MDDDKKTEEKDSGAPLTMGELKDFIKQQFEEFAGSTEKKPETKESVRQTASSKRTGIIDDVRTALKEIQDGEAAEKEKSDTNTRLSAVEERVKEKPPIERRRVHRIMGWGEPSE